jgi:hypothetical protein
MVAFFIMADDNEVRPQFAGIKDPEKEFFIDICLKGANSEYILKCTAMPADITFMVCSMSLRGLVLL